MAESKVDLLQPPRGLAELPIRLSAGIGFVYFATSLTLLEAGGVPKGIFLPIVGILAALGVFIYRTVGLVAGLRYRRRLRGYAQQGLIVFVPLTFFRQVAAQYGKQAQTMPLTLFDADLKKTAALVELFKQEGLSKKVVKMVDALTAPPAPKS
ncbi:MAG TPA: hypothetical protein VLF60_03380 [Candidatus Saccharimonadales bacterium]|nr:hypothetical protein [Candidatus Saccharimonadales bacterium]